MQQKLLTLVLLAALANTLQMQSPPPLSQTFLGTLRPSPADGRFITSGLDSLELVHLTQTDSAAYRTSLTLNYYESSGRGSYSKASMEMAGNWTHLDSSDGLSCNLLYDSVSQLLGAVRFERDTGKLSLVGELPVSLLVGGSASLKHSQVRLHVSADCTLLSRSQGNKFAVFRPKNDWSAIDEVLSLPNQPQFSDDLMQLVWNHTLLKYSKNTGTYAPVLTMPPSQNYQLISKQERVVLLAKNSTPPETNGFLKTDSEVSVLLLSPTQSSAQLVHSFRVEGAVEKEGAMAGQQRMELLVSPSLSKVGVYFRSQEQSLLLWHINYEQSLAHSLSFQDLPRILQTCDGIDFEREFTLSQDFIVVRNITEHAAQPTLPVLEEGYQLIAGTVMLLRYRDLTANTRELTEFQRGLVAPSDQGLIIVNEYASSPSEFRLVQFDYGSLGVVYQPEAEQEVPWLTVADPEGSSALSVSQEWVWFHLLDRGVNTVVTATRMDSDSVDRKKQVSIVLTGSWGLKYYNARVLIAYSLKSAEVVMYKYDHQNNTLILYGNLTASLAALPRSPLAHWKASLQGDRFSLDQYIFSRLAIGEYRLVSSPSQLSWTAIDFDLITVLDYKGQLQRLSPENQTFTLLYSPPSAFASDSSLVVRGSRIAVVSVSEQEEARVDILVQQNGKVSSILSERWSFSSHPSVFFSPGLTKVMAVGRPARGGPLLQVVARHIDFSDQSWRIIDFPREPLEGSSQLVVALGESFFHARQMGDQAELHHFTYFLSGQIYPKLIDRRRCKLMGGRRWQKTLITESGRLSAAVVSEYLDPVVRLRSLMREEVQAMESRFDNGEKYMVARTEQKGIKICPLGCRNCQCEACFPGFVIVPGLPACRPCPLGCIECPAQNPRACTKCAPGMLLEGTVCRPCAEGCLECLDSPEHCTNCPPAHFVMGGQCLPCSAHCFQCSNAVSCSVCQQGFTLLKRGVCAACSPHCTSCLADNVTHCTGCHRGLHLVDGKCSLCSSNCLECSPLGCDTCVAGFAPDSQGHCQPLCQLPCLTCSPTDPTICLTCPARHTLQNQKCILDLDCNQASQCTDCGQGSNFLLVPSSRGANCLPCTPLQNCLQCDTGHRCRLCADGYFRTADGHCGECPSSCQICRGRSQCSACRGGFTLVGGDKEGRCLACDSPCATCWGSPAYCLTCLSGFNRYGRSCLRSALIRFTFTIIGAIDSQVMSQERTLKAGLLDLLGSQEEQDVLFESLRAGSLLVAGTAQVPLGADPVQTASVFSAALVKGIPGSSFSVGSVSVSLVDWNQSQSTSSDGGSSSRLVIVAEVVSALIIIMIIVVFLYLYRIRSARSHQQQQEGGSEKERGEKEKGEKEKGQERREQVEPVPMVSEGTSPVKMENKQMRKFTSFDSANPFGSSETFGNPALKQII